MEGARINRPDNTILINQGVSGNMDGATKINASMKNGIKKTVRQPTCTIFFRGVVEPAIGVIGGKGGGGKIVPSQDVGVGLTAAAGFTRVFAAVRGGGVPKDTGMGWT